MEIEEVVRKAGSQQAKDALKKLLTRYLNPAFGALPKAEVELIILDALEELGVISKEPQVYELVTTLRVTRTKARNLTYERELRRSSPSALDKRVKELLRNPIIDKKGSHFILEVENPLVSDHLRDKVQKLGHISDGSFSPSIVKLSVNAFVALVEDYLGDDTETARQVLVESGAPDKSLRGVVNAAAMKFSKRIASDAGEEVMKDVSSFFGAMMDGSMERLRGVAGELFRDSE